jgi:pimeloyl-ACP methyl ester carboxylesterase
MLMNGNVLCLITVVILSLGIPQWSRGEVVAFNTGEVAGFENMVFKLDKRGHYGTAHSYGEVLRFLWHNRSLSGDFDRINENEAAGEIGAVVDRTFIKSYITATLDKIEVTEDIFDTPGSPGNGYEFDLRIVHPGTQPGVLDGNELHPIIIICQGRFAGAAGGEGGYDWLANYYANKGYVVAIPRLLENFFEDPRTRESNATDILALQDVYADVAALQVSDTITYLVNHFDRQVNGLKVTLIGHSNGGYVALLTATKDWRIRRLAFLSSVFKLYGQWNGEEWIEDVLQVLDSYDAFRYLNLRRTLTRFAWWLLGEGPALHVQRGIANDDKCPPGIPCDWLVDMVPLPGPYDLSRDPWVSFKGCGGPCDDKLLTFYNWSIYEGPKENGVQDNPYTDHGFQGDQGRTEALRLLDHFFDTVSID